MAPLGAKPIWHPSELNRTVAEKPQTPKPYKDTLSRPIAIDRSWPGSNPGPLAREFRALPIAMHNIRHCCNMAVTYSLLYLNTSHPVSTPHLTGRQIGFAPRGPNNITRFNLRLCIDNSVPKLSLHMALGTRQGRCSIDRAVKALIIGAWNNTNIYYQNFVL